MKKKILSLALALIMTLSLATTALAAEDVLLIAPAPAAAPTYELDTVRTGNMGGLEDGIYNHPEYFDEDGVMGVVADGNFYINDFAVPATLEELTALEGGFVVNSGTSTLAVVDGVIMVDGKNKGYTFESAIQALVNDNLPGGLHFDLYDNDGDTKTDVVKMWYTEGVIVNGISTDADGNYVLSRGDLTYVPSYAGRLYDADNFSGKLDEVIKPENFDATIEEGDCAIFYLTPDGWVVERATEINGIYEDGKDHGYYQIDGVQYPDTMKYSRDNLIVAQRNGEYNNAHQYFGFNGNDDGLKTSLWLDPKSGSPIGLSANENAKTFLTEALAVAKFKYEGTKLADDASEAQKIAYAALGEAVELAEKTLADETSLNSEFDFYTYYLYLNLNGTGNDIGAAFAGFFGVNGWGFKNPYPGFDALFGTTYGLPVAGIDTVRTGNKGGLEDGIYNHPEYFDENGVMGVVEAGGFYINDFQLPASAEELAALEGGFVVNQGTTTLAVVDGKIMLDGKDEFATYEEAVKAFVSDELPGGLHFDLYDGNGDGVTDIVKMWYTEGVLVNSIEETDNEDFIVHRGDLTYVPSNIGRLYDKEDFAGEGYTILENNFDESIEEGDVAIFYYTPDGWIMERAVEVNGMFMGGEDHHFYNIDGVEYGDTMKYSRDNLIVAQRNGEYTNAHKYFGFINNAEGLKTSLWMDPKSASPIGLSANENAKAFLEAAVAQAKAKLAAVTLGSNATAEQKFAYDSLKEAIELAEKTLADEASLNSEYDFYTYYLYLSLAGTGNDIGAAFSGFYSGKDAGFNWGFKNAYPGFDSLFEGYEAVTEYTVVKGDCLWNIAKEFYGNGAAYTKIVEANGIKDANLIYVGQKLVIPA